ncbi:metallopeptidase family protein [bacterium]|nr:metallopeptidase family protein [bacterium]
MTYKEFEELVKQGVEQLPPHIRKLLENVDIVIEDWPSEDIIKKLKLPNKYSLFGLYQGIPKTKRGSHYANVLPDKITLFKKPIENSAKNSIEIKNLVKKVVWHEIAHHFGLDEKRVRELEKKKFQKL